MSKGSNYWGQGSGKLGNTVLYKSKGQEITRSYVDNPANPKTPKQMTQRAKFAAAVAFFKASRQALFKFAYEDKKETESDYNAYMRHNTSLTYIAPKELVDAGTAVTQAFGYYILSEGRLQIPAPTNDGENEWIWPLTLSSTSNVTWGQVSANLMNNYNLRNGDIITFVSIETNITETQDGPAIANKNNRWQIEQALIDETSTATITSVFEKIPIGSVDDAGLHISIKGYQSGNGTFICIIASRNTTDGLQVSTSAIVPNVMAEGILDVMKTEAQQAKNLQTWNPKEQAILQGTLVK